MSDQFLFTTPNDPRAKPMFDELIVEYDSRYGTHFSPKGAAEELNRYPAELFAPPDGNFLLLIRNGETIGGGAFKRFDATTAEFKRVWTRKDLRRQGLARIVLEQLEAQAAAQGYSRVYLTTGFRQPEAVGLYLRHGYSALFDLDAEPETIGKLPFEKHLVGPGTYTHELLRGRSAVGTV